MKGLTDIPGIRVGHISDYDAITGCTAILCERGAVGGVDIRGSASGTQEIDTLSPCHVDDAGARHPAGGRQRFRPGSGRGRAPLPGAARGGLPFRRPAYSHCARRDSVRPRNRQVERSPRPGDGRSRRRRRHHRRGRGRMRGRGHRRHRGQALRHEAGDEVGDWIVHGDAPRRRAGGEPGSGERIRRRARPGFREDRWPARARPPTAGSSPVRWSG